MSKKYYISCYAFIGIMTNMLSLSTGSLIKAGEAVSFK
jgi:hypothetical protein